MYVSILSVCCFISSQLLPLPETLSIGVTRPTLAPIQHLHKYFKQQQGVSIDSTSANNLNTSSSGGNSGSSGSAGNNSSSANDSSSIILGPTFLSRHTAMHQAQSTTAAARIGATSQSEHNLR